MDFRGSIGFIGGGNMAEALLAGIARDGAVPPARIAVAEPREERRAHLAMHYGATATTDNAAVARDSGTLFLAVKPQVLPEVLREIAPHLTRGQLVISIAAGFPLRKLAAALPGVPLLRAMPNTPALIGAGATVISPGLEATDEMVAWARKLFTGVGLCLALPEEKMDAVTGLSGSGPAYVFLMAEAMAEGGVRAGLPREEAGRLALQTLYGAARMMLETEKSPADLRASVTSPGGTTVEGLRTLDADGFGEAVIHAIGAAAARSKQLGS